MSTQNYNGVNPRVREVRDLAPLSLSILTTSTLPGVQGLINMVPVQRLKQETSVPPSPTAGHNGLPTPSPTYGHLCTHTSCLDCGSPFSVSPLQDRCDECISASEEPFHSLDTRTLPRTPRSPSYEENMAPLHRLRDGRISKSSITHSRPLKAEAFWSRRSGSPVPPGLLTRAEPNIPPGGSRSVQKRVGKAKREQESRSKQGFQLKKIEDLVLASDYRSTLEDTTELNSNNAQKSGLKYRKEVVMEGCYQTMLHQATELRAQATELRAYHEFIRCLKVQLPTDHLQACGLWDMLQTLHDRTASHKVNRQSKL